MNNKIPKWIFVSLALLFGFPVWAEDCILHIHTTSGEKIDVLIQDGAECDIYGGDEACPEKQLCVYTGSCSVQSGKMQPWIDQDGNIRGAILYEMPLANLDEISFSNSSGIKGIESTAPAIFIRQGVLHISGVTSPIHISVSDLSGIVKYDKMIDADMEIDLSGVGSGTHVVKAGNANFKILIQ